MGESGSAAAALAGLRVVTTRGASRDDRLRLLLEAAGADVLSWPTCEYPPPRDPGPLEVARARLDRFDWVVFTSARAVAAMGEARDLGRSGPAAPEVAVVGPATGRAATRAGWPVAVEGRGPGARGLAAQVAAAAPVTGARVLFPAASGAAPTVEEEFTALGARVTRVEAYRTVVTPPPPARVRAGLAAGVDAVTFASPSAVEAVERALRAAVKDAATGDSATGDPSTGDPPGDPVTDGTGVAATGDRSLSLSRALAGIAVVCIGPTTCAALERRRVAGVRVASTATLEGLVNALVEQFGSDAAASDGMPCQVGMSDVGRPDANLGGASPRAGVPFREVTGRPSADPGRAPSARAATALIAGAAREHHRRRTAAGPGGVRHRADRPGRRLGARP